MVPRKKSVKATQKLSAVGIAPRQKLVKCNQQLSEELKFLEDENYARLKIRFDELERNMDLAMIQINSRLEAGIPPDAQNPAALNDKLKQLQGTSVALEAKISELESTCREILGRAQAQAKGAADLSARVKELGDNAVASNHQLKGKISELESTCCEILGGMEVEKNGQVAISSHNQAFHLSQDEIFSLRTDLDSIREAMRTSEEAIMKNNQELLKHGAELNEMQTLGKQVSERIENLEKSSRHSQKKFAGQASQIKSLLEGGQSVTQRQDLIDVNFLAYPKLNLGQTKKCNEVQEIQHRSLNAAIELLKQWVLSANKKELQPIFEQAMGNSNEIQKQRLELDALKDMKQQLHHISQDQCELSDKLVTMESTERQTTTQTSTELVQQRHQINSMLNLKAEVEQKILGLEQAHEINKTILSKANSDIHSLMQQNQLISQRQNHIDNNFSEFQKQSEVLLGKAHPPTDIQNELQVTKVACDFPEFQLLIDQMKRMQETVIKLSNFMIMQMKLCPQNENPIQKESLTTNPRAQKSPILVEDGFVTVEEGLSNAEGCTSNFPRRRGVQDESDIDADDEDEDELNQRRCASEMSWSKRAPPNFPANSGGRDYTDEDSDLLPDPNHPSTSSRPFRAPEKIKKREKWIRIDKENTPRKPKKKSLRQERKNMQTEEEEDNKNLSNAVQMHIQILTGLQRHKNAFPCSPSLEELEKLPVLEEGTSLVSVSAPYTVKNVVRTWDPDDQMGDNFSIYCLRRCGKTNQNILLLHNILHKHHRI
ncbi:hypothetical protein PSTG_02298 [Puccinia striiformis f. sp. tritici PST-78]|uniref:Uncharacterized protein n=1 Tax=Puccinia striiformis f. sp. tritici PST-78 TaxID=1165861 RepID=A0A0L0VYU7_9BASI|nr:hypothetical protein PSTG_02298 [Puccinia striiformis f. sp. tritici PST-78]